MIMVVPGLRSPIQVQNVFADLLDSLIVDVATEAHRGARLGVDYRLDNGEEEEAQLSARARASVGEADTCGGSESGGGGKHAVDVFGSSHPTIANEMFDCMNCGRPIVAGRFAPHLEKCMGKGRKARLKSNWTVGSLQQRRARASSLAPPPATNVRAQTGSNGTTSRVQPRSPAEDSHRSFMDVNDGFSDKSPEDERELSPGLPPPAKARTKKYLKPQRASLGALSQQASTSMVGTIPPSSSGGGGGGANQASPPGGVSKTGLVSRMLIHCHGGAESASVSASHMTGNSGHSGIISLMGAVKQRRPGEKKKNLEQVLAGSARMPTSPAGGDARANFDARFENADGGRAPSHRDHVWHAG